MAITVRTNSAAGNALTDLNKTSRALSRSFERISSGLRISRAADDAAGLGVAENLRASSSSAVVAGRNINDGMSIIAEIEIVIVTMHESAVAASLAVHLVAHRTSAMIEASLLAVGAAVVNDMIPVITYAMVVTVVTGQNAIVDPMVTTTARASRTSVLSMKAITVQLVQVHLRRLTAALW